MTQKSENGILVRFSTLRIFHVNLTNYEGGRLCVLLIGTVPRVNMATSERGRVLHIVSCGRKKIFGQYLWRDFPKNRQKELIGSTFLAVIYAAISYGTQIPFAKGRTAGH